MDQLRQPVDLSAEKCRQNANVINYIGEKLFAGPEAGKQAITQALFCTLFRLTLAQRCSQKPEFFEKYLSFFGGVLSKLCRKSRFLTWVLLKMDKNLSFFKKTWVFLDPEFFSKCTKKSLLTETILLAINDSWALTIFFQCFIFLIDWLYCLWLFSALLSATYIV